MLVAVRKHPLASAMRLFLSLRSPNATHDAVCSGCMRTERLSSVNACGWEQHKGKSVFMSHVRTRKLRPFFPCPKEITKAVRPIRKCTRYVETKLLLSDTGLCARCNQSQHGGACRIYLVETSFHIHDSCFGASTAKTPLISTGESTTESPVSQGLGEQSSKYEERTTLHAYPSRVRHLPCPPKPLPHLCLVSPLLLHHSKRLQEVRIVCAVLQAGLVQALCFVIPSRREKKSMDRNN